MKPRTLLLAAAAAAVVVTVLAMGGRDPSKPASAPPPAPAPEVARPPARAQVSPSGELQAPTWTLSPRPSDAGPVAGVPASGVPGSPFPAGQGPSIPPSMWPDRIATLARQVASGTGGDPFELYSLLNECAQAPHRLALTTGCVSGGDCSPSVQRSAEVQETLAACQQVPQDLVARRQQYLDLAASRGDARAQAARQR